MDVRPPPTLTGIEETAHKRMLGGGEIDLWCTEQHSSLQKAEKHEQHTLSTAAARKGKSDQVNGRGLNTCPNQDRGSYDSLPQPASHASH